MENIVLPPTEPSGAVVLFVGHECCAPGHSFGPYVRDCCIVHFCLKGCGVLCDGRGTHTVTAGSLFVIRPGEPTVYRADMKDPWEYVWIAFRGERAFCLGGVPSVHKTPSELDIKLYEAVLGGSESTDLYNSILYELLHSFGASDGLSCADTRIRQIRRYIRYNYMLPITVGSLAEEFKIDRSYLYREFKNRYGVGVKEYLTRLRMDKARELLSLGHTVTECAAMVGYLDTFNFSKAFKSRFGIPPSRVGRD